MICQVTQHKGGGTVRREAGPSIQTAQVLKEHIGWAVFRLGDFGEEVAATA